MAGLLFIVLLQFIWSIGEAQRSTGGGAFSYTDSSGKRYSGTYGLQDGKIFRTSGDPVPFSDFTLPGYGYGFDYGYQGEDFYPIFFSNFENLLEEVFKSNIESQKLAYNAARKAYDLSSNQAGYIPNFATRLPPFQDVSRFRSAFPSFPRFPSIQMNNLPNSAYASSALGPGFRHQVAAINPENPLSMNVNINRVSPYADSDDRSGYYAVSSKSYSSSSNLNGQPVNHRGAETTVNDNGRVTSYKVQS